MEQERFHPWFHPVVLSNQGRVEADNKPRLEPSCFFSLSYLGNLQRKPSIQNDIYLPKSSRGGGEKLLSHIQICCERFLEIQPPPPRLHKFNFSIKCNQPFFLMVSLFVGQQCGFLLFYIVNDFVSTKAWLIKRLPSLDKDHFVYLSRLYLLFISL